MRNELKTSRRWLSAWVFPLALLALPNCLLDSSGFEDGDPMLAFDPGGSPTSAVMCDIPKPLLEGESDCATQDEIDAGLSMTSAATALAEGSGMPIKLDWSPAAISACNGPKKTTYFEGNFPDGMTVCINCGQFPNVFASPTKACIAKCIDLVNASSDGTVDATAFCGEKATVSTNYESCAEYDGACTSGGNPVMIGNFFDPRRHQEPVVWTDFFGTDVIGANNNGLKRTADTTGFMDSDFNAGAASDQIIFKGDAWVEFEAGQTGLSHVIGLRESCDKALNCPDDDPSLIGIGFSLSLNNDNGVYVLEGGTPLFVHTSSQTYAANERFRVRATDNNDGTATITYTRVAPGCTEGTACTEDLIYTSLTHPAYPLRVDAIFREKDATLDNVTIVRIKKQ